MAEGIDPKNEEALKALADYVNKFGAQSKTLTDRFSDLNQAVKTQKEGLEKNNKDSKEQIELNKQQNLKENQFNKKYIEDRKKFAAEQERLVKTGEITKKQEIENLAKYNENLANQIEDPELKASFLKLSQGLDHAADRVKFYEDSVNRVSENIKFAGENIVKPVLGIVTSYRDAGGQIGLSAKILQTGVQATGSALTGIGGAATTAAQGIAGVTPASRALKLGLTVAGTAASLFGSAASAVAQQVLPFLQKEIEHSIESFQSLSRSGALFSGGVTEMVHTAGRAGLTLEQFDKFVQKNSQSLAGLGEGVTAGAKRAANALNAGGDSMRKSLLNLGFGIEEQASLVAETMRDMRQAGGPLTATDSQIAQQTQKYAENLRIIAGITGEDAKKKMDEARQASQDLAFQQKLQGMGQVEQQNLINAMGNMNEIERKAFQEMVTFGQVITPSLAATVSQSGALQEKLNATMGAFQQGTLDATTFQNLGKQYNEQIKSDMLSLTGLAQAGAAGVGGIVGEMYKGLNSVFQDVIKQTPQAIEAAQKAAKDQSETNDKLTQSMNNVVVKNQELAMKIQQTILDSNVLGAYASATEKATDAMLAMVNAFRKEMGMPGTGGTGGEKSQQEKQQDMMSGALTGALEGAALGAMLGPWGAAGGALIGGIYGALKTQKPEDLAKAMQGVGPNVPLSESGTPMFVTGAASGGIMSGPSSGYPVMLHGKEMVIPLPEEIGPNDVKKSPLEAGGQAMSDADYVKAMAADQLAKMMKTDDSVPVLTRLSDQMEELLTATRLVVANTERTARGVA